MKPAGAICRHEVYQGFGKVGWQTQDDVDLELYLCDTSLSGNGARRSACWITGATSYTPDYSESSQFREPTGRSS